MIEPINEGIIQNFELYIKVFNEDKTVVNSTIKLSQKGKNRDALAGDSEVLCHNVSDLNLLVQANRSKTARYGIKLMAKTICEPPFFRFDASGSAHLNRSPNAPLPLQRITTPHFHSYDRLGFNTAYKTPELNDEGIIMEIERNINFGMTLFCQEARIFTENKEFPEVQIDSPFLPFPQVDPIINVPFG